MADDQQVQELDPGTFATLFQAKHGIGPAARVAFLAEAGERFAVPMSELQNAWTEAARRVSQEH